MIREISKIKIDVMADIQHAFYVDFMPIIQQVQKDVSSLSVEEKDNLAVERINKNLSRAENILKHLENISVKAKENNDLLS